VADLPSGLGVSNHEQQATPLAPPEDPMVFSLYCGHSREDTWDRRASGLGSWGWRAIGSNGSSWRPRGRGRACESGSSAAGSAATRVLDTRVLQLEVLALRHQLQALYRRYCDDIICLATSRTTCERMVLAYAAARVDSKLPAYRMLHFDRLYEGSRERQSAGFWKGKSKVASLHDGFLSRSTTSAGRNQDRLGHVVRHRQTDPAEQLDPLRDLIDELTLLVVVFVEQQVQLIKGRSRHLPMVFLVQAAQRVERTPVHPPRLFEDAFGTGHPIGALTDDEMSYDIESAPAAEPSFAATHRLGRPQRNVFNVDGVRDSRAMVSGRLNAVCMAFCFGLAAHPHASTAQNHLDDARTDLG
jgi:hypothetical protein